jgi:hypothetical protein
VKLLEYKSDLFGMQTTSLVCCETILIAEQTLRFLILLIQITFFLTIDLFSSNMFKQGWHLAASCGIVKRIIFMNSIR